MLQPQSQQMPVVHVSGAVLKWARDLRSLSIEDAALQLGISSNELQEYENEDKRPLVGLLRLMSQKYQINFTSLLMPAPLPAMKRPADHRVRTDRTPLSMVSILAIEEVSEALEAFADIAADSERIVPKLNIGRAELTDNPENVAAIERRRFGVSVDEQQSWKSTAKARIEWRNRMEQLGVFTYMIPMPLMELSGFSVFHEALAAICINDRETTEGAKIFTLFHEYYHLLLRQAAISDENNSDHVERLCNQFAASFLIPRNALSREIGDVELPCDFSTSQIQQLSTKFRVSGRAMALRLEKAGFAPVGFYDRLTTPWEIPKERPRVLADARIAIPLRIKRLGRLHVNTVIRAAQRRAINSFDAHDLIGLKTSLPKIQAALG